MFRATAFLTALVLSVGIASAQDVFEKAATTDAPGSADSTYTGRYEGSIIIGQRTLAFEDLTLPSGPAEGKLSAKDKKFASVVTHQGRVTRTLYSSPEGRSTLEVFGNYADALKSNGFATVYECANTDCGESFKVLKYDTDAVRKGVTPENSDQGRDALIKAMFLQHKEQRYALMKNGGTYVAVFAADSNSVRMGNASKAVRGRVGVLIEILEPGTREDKIVVLSSDKIGSDIAASGRVVLYGIFFDTDAATIKPESQDQLDQMVAYLQAHPKVKVYVTGHTDNQGGLDYNMKLSGGRAIAVTKALTKAGVDADRMTPKAVGPLAPLAPNSDDSGRAKNRRVELVEQ